MSASLTYYTDADLTVLRVEDDEFCAECRSRGNIGHLLRNYGLDPHRYYSITDKKDGWVEIRQETPAS